MLKMRKNRHIVGGTLSLLTAFLGVLILSVSDQANAKSLGIDLNAEIKNIPETVHVGDRGKLDYKIKNINGISTTGKVDFTSSDPSIFKFGQDGNWQAVKPGIATFHYDIMLSQTTISELLGNEYDDLETPTKYEYYTVTVLPETLDVYRLYNPNSGEHFYTKATIERNALTKVGWQLEGNAWKAYSNGIPVYRVYNPNAGDHHYTTSKSEVNMLVAHGWHDEGVSFNSSAQKDQPIYRLYNPNTKAGAHHYTKDLNEKNSLASLGWKYEGVSWYDE
ncbi:hypothetical protein [Enterococcus sp. CSURQ0835]|uniref:hypothetical protein n=1 Tax=Enterococcus sp. CSURQ0835 TaxID=2681394 RepID=UPI00135C9730|nr:hypothetical protein [Enterococcus sp. CSURQ0835]